MGRPLVLSSLVALALASPALAPPVGAQARVSLPMRFDADVARALRQFQVPGVAIAVVKDGRVLLAKGYGVRRAGDATRVDPHTLFQIASNTKAFTTACIAMLVDAGSVAWDDRVTKYLPDFQLADPWVTREFTIRDLVTHRSGLGLGAGDLLWLHSTYGRAEIIRRLRAAPPVSSFRSQYAYDNVLYAAAGEIIPAATGKSWETFVRERILAPLGMTETRVGVGDLRPGDPLAAPHGVVDGRPRIVPLDTVDNIAPAGAFLSSVTDLSKWLLVQLACPARRAFADRRLETGRNGLVTTLRTYPELTPVMAASPPPTPARRDRRRLVGCAVVLVVRRLRARVAAPGLPRSQDRLAHRRTRRDGVDDDARARSAARDRDSDKRGERCVRGADVRAPGPLLRRRTQRLDQGV